MSDDLSDHALDVIDYIIDTNGVEAVFNVEDIKSLVREVRRHRQMLIHDRRTTVRIFCGFYDCNLSVGHSGPHRGPCGCINGCKALECPNA